MFSLISFKYCENQNIEIPKMIYTFKFPTKRLSYNLLISLKKHLSLPSPCFDTNVKARQI